MIISASLLVAPITLEGSTALSVDTNTNLSEPNWLAASAIVIVPETLIFIASKG